MRPICITALLICSSFLLGKPAHHSTVHGRVSFDSSKEGLMIVQAGSDKSIVNWEKFSIALGEEVRFHLPSKTSAILNRVTGGSPSILQGLLQSNGKVYLINPQGIVLSKEGVIDTAGFLASTLDLTDKQFLEDNFLFEGSSTEGIAIHGKVISSDGDAVFIGYTIEKTGSVQTPHGITAIGVGQRIVVHPAGEERITIIPTDSPRAEMGLAHAGSIEAHQIELKADGNVYSLAINDAGLIQANGFEEHAGRIILKADGGFAATSGNLTANGQNQGGTIQILGKNVYVNGTLEATGAFGGGTIDVGGGPMGTAPANYNAETAFVDKSGVLITRATTKGDGGLVSIFGQEAYFHGSIDARGGPKGGNGGEVDIIGLQISDIKGTINNSAPKGLLGTRHLDPLPIVELYQARIATLEPVVIAPQPIEILYQAPLLSSSFPVINIMPGVKIQLPDGFFYLIAFESAEMSNNLKLFDGYVWLDPFNLCLQGGKTKTIQSSFDFANCQ